MSSLLSKRFAVFQVGLDDHDELPNDLGQQHEDPVPHLEGLPIVSERMLQPGAWQLLHTVPGVLQQRVSLHVLTS